MRNSINAVLVGTFTLRFSTGLTGAMLDRVFLRARELVEEDPQTR